MTERLLAAFRAAERIPPHEQDELAIRILADIAPECIKSRAWRPSAEVGRQATVPVPL